MSNFVLKNLYELGPVLKEDAIGILYAGTILKNNLPVTIREYHHQYCHASIVEKIQEAVLQSADLHHPGIVRIIDSIYTEEGRLYLIYDTPYEGSLADILAKVSAFDEKQTVTLLHDLGKALEYAHQKHIIHGTINPDNIDVLADGQTKLRNFFIDGLLNSFILDQGRSIQNATYLAPEQLRGEKTTKSADIYALGVLGYQLLSGQKPYPEVTSIPMMLKNFHKPPEKLTLINTQIPKYLEDILEKAVQAKPAYRQQSVLELLGDLRNKKVTIGIEELKRREAEQAMQNPPEPPAPPAHRRAPVYTNSKTTYQYANIERPRSNRTEPRKKVQSINNNPEIENEPPRLTLKDNNIQKILFYVLVGVFGAVIFLIIHSLFVSYFEAVPKVSVPPIIGRQLVEAERMLSDSGLRYKIVSYVTNNDISPNCVVSSEPEPERIVKKFRIVKLFVSKGSEEITMPSLVERDLSTVETILQEKGLVLKVTERVFSTKYLRNQIMKQSPEPNTYLKKGAEVQVTISNGYPVSLQLIDTSEKSTIVKLALSNQPDWEAQNVLVYLQDRNGRRKYFEKLLSPGERKDLEIVTDSDAVIEVYYFNDLAYKQELKYITVKDEQPSANNR